MQKPKANSDRLDMWVIYYPKQDSPEHYYAVRWRCDVGPEPMPTDDIMKSVSLTALRDHASRGGRVCFARDPADDPAVMETWL